MTTQANICVAGGRADLIAKHLVGGMTGKTGRALDIMVRRVLCLQPTGGDKAEEHMKSNLPKNSKSPSPNCGEGLAVVHCLEAGSTIKACS